MLDKVIKEAKFKFENRQFEYRLENPKSLWKMFNSKIGNSESKSTKIVYSTDKSNNKIIYKDEIAKSLNIYFYTIGHKLSGKIRNPNNIKENMSNNCDNTIFFRHTSESDCKNSIKNK